MKTPPVSTALGGGSSLWRRWLVGLGLILSVAIVPGCAEESTELDPEDTEGLGQELGSPDEDAVEVDGLESFGFDYAGENVADPESGYVRPGEAEEEPEPHPWTDRSDDHDDDDDEHIQTYDNAI